MKKLIAAAMALLLTLTVCASCAPAGKTLDEVLAAGELVVATSPDFPPFEMYEDEENSAGAVIGIEIELMQLICAELGVTMNLKTMNFDSILTGVQTGKFDCGVSGISVTPAREKKILFTDAYCLAAQCIVVRADSTIASKADLAGKTVSVQTGTTAEEACMEEGYNVLSFENNTEAKGALAERADAWVVDNLTALQMVAEGDGLVVLDEELTKEPYAFAFCKGSETLVAEINRILEGLIADGTIKAIFEKYGEDYVAPAN